ncbi:MAG: hypothetical protein JWL73_96 [Actinomycetia bacterium]|nr:hypothetical protein [Actinomycetes bacterium]
MTAPDSWIRQLALVFDGSKAAVLATQVEHERAQGRVIYANAAFVDQMGYPLSEIIGRPSNMFRGPHSGSTPFARLDAALAARVPVSEAYINHRRDGQAIWIQANIHTIGATADRPTTRISIRHEITDLVAEHLQWKVSIEQGSDLVAVLDEDECIRYLSPSADATLGVAPGSLVGESVRSLVHPDDWHYVADKVDEQPIELRVRTRNGEWVWHEFDWRDMRADPLVRGIVVSAHDVTHRKALDAERLAATELSRLVSDLLPMGVWEWEIGPDRFRWSVGKQSAARLLRRNDGVPLSTLLGAAHPSDRAAVERALRGAAEPGGSCDFEFRVHDNQSDRRLLVRGETQSETDANGVERAVRVVGAILDVTKTHAAEARVAEILETVSDGYFAVDDEWHLTYVNRRSEEIWHQDRSVLLGRNLWEKYPELLGTEFERMFREAMERRSPVEGDAYLGVPDAWYQLRVYPLVGGIAVYFRDISEQKAADAEREAFLAAEQEATREAKRARELLAHAATHDALTDLPNRALLFTELAAMLDDPESAVALLFLDLDRFKVVNDSLGHIAGDELLVRVAERLVLLGGSSTLIARLGGDEFVLVTRRSEPEAVVTFAQYVVEELRVPFRVNGRDLVIAASIGIAHATPDSTPSTLLRDADAALYRAKAGGRDQVAVHDDLLRAEANERLELETELRTAIGGHELVLYYQPIIRVRDRAPVGSEALVRWNNPRRGLLQPDSFIGLAEETGLVNRLGEWALGEASRQIVAWRGRPGVPTGRIVWVNVSGRQLQTHVSLADTVGRIMSWYGLAPGELGVEVTESVLMREPELAQRELEKLRALGVPFAIDDFGTGYSSLSYLQRFRPDVLKIDQSFIAGVNESETRHIVQSIIDVSHAVNASVTAEGVERGEQLRILLNLGCDNASGYLLGRPSPAEASIAAEPAFVMGDGPAKVVDGAVAERGLRGR